MRMITSLCNKFLSIFCIFLQCLTLLFVMSFFCWFFFDTSCHNRKRDSPLSWSQFFLFYFLFSYYAQQPITFFFYSFCVFVIVVFLCHSFSVWFFSPTIQLTVYPAVYTWPPCPQCSHGHHVHMATMYTWPPCTHVCRGNPPKRPHWSSLKPTLVPCFISAELPLMLGLYALCVYLGFRRPPSKHETFI